MAFKSTMLFDCLGNILVDKSEEIYNEHINNPFFKDFTKFMCLRYLTMSPNQNVRNTILKNYIALERIEDTKHLYKLLIKIVPQQKNRFIKYIKENNVRE